MTQKCVCCYCQAQHFQYFYKKFLIKRIKLALRTDMRSKSKPVKLQAIPAKKKLKIEAEQFRSAKHEAQSPQQTAVKTPPQKYQEQRQPNCNSLNNLQTIKDLYENLYGWKMLVRVTDISYKQFTSKAGHFTQLLALDIIDKYGSMITAKFFGQSATQMKERIEVDKVYLVSKGKIVEQRGNYVRNLSSKLSILFNAYSLFQEVQDLGTIPEIKKWTSISEALKLSPSEKTYSFVGILVTVGEQKIFKRGDREMVLQSLQVGDPIRRELVQCSVWDRQIKLDQSLRQKSILLKHFRPHLYQDKISLVSTYRSEIVPHKAFQKYQSQHTKYPRNQKNVHLISLKDLYEQTQGTVENVVSHIQAWVSYIGFDQKWFYEACPKCSKACISNAKCTNCSLDVGETVKRFMLTIELADSTGSITVTAFNDSAPSFLKSSTIADLLKYDSGQLLEFGFGQLYEEFLMQIFSKRDKEGRSVHNIIGEPIPVNHQKISICNLAKIRAILKQSTLTTPEK